MTEQHDYTGIWSCSYWYPSNEHSGEDLSEYYVEVHQKGNKLVLESLPNKTDAYMMVRLTVNDNLATGNWEENTAPLGAFQGMTYSGALQLIVSDDRSRMDGKWVGVGQEKGKAQIYTGRWELVRAGSRAPIADGRATPTSK